MPIDISTPQLFYIEKGASITRITYQLEKENIWHYPNFAKWFFRGASYVAPIQSGEYALEPGMRLYSLANQWAKGSRVQRHLTFIPGQDLSKISRAIIEAEGIEGLKNAAILKNKINALAKKYHMTKGSMEGVFFPDTYAYEYGDDYHTILARAYEQWKQKTNALWQKEGKNSPYDSLYEASIVASLIQKEGRTEKDKKLISGVIQNRLRKHMPLQIDATVIYALGEEYKGKLTHADMSVPSPYNTYHHRGLPPTPIAIFTLEDLHAALYPAKHDYLYYVLSKNGEHIFSSNYKAHRENIRTVNEALNK